MIKVFVSETAKTITCIEVKGHANSDEEGKDLVCAAVSAVVTGCINALKDTKDFNVEAKTGYVKVEAKAQPSEHDAVVLETMVKSLETICEVNSDFIKIKFL